MAERSCAESGPGSKLGAGLRSDAARLTLAEILEWTALALKLELPSDFRSWHRAAQPARFRATAE